MNQTAELRIRRSLTDLQDEYAAGNKKPLEDLVRAWKVIKELPPDDTHSFFTLGGYHGEPFRGAGWGSAAYWGGYCNHANVLFPTWHRVYLVKVEEALQSVPGCEDVMLPYWDETSIESLTKGIPWALTQEQFVLDGEAIPNPLRSFVFTRAIVDNVSGDVPKYSKPKGYETVRYPLSGLVGTAADIAATKAHNAQFPDYATNVQLLNENVKNWLTEQLIVDGKPVKGGGYVARMYENCLHAPNYTVFSNTTSAAEWNNIRAGGDVGPVVPLEAPHNSIHLAVGGFDVPALPEAPDFSPIAGANGDMGENDTAGLDPIFFFHHCFVDRMFWLWQKKNGYTDHLDVIEEYPGTNSVDGQNPTPGTVPNSWLTLESPLNPFKLVDGGKERPYTSLDCINIERQLGFTYGPGSLGDPAAIAAEPATPARVIAVTGVNRAPIRGSFSVAVFGNVAGKRLHLGTEAVLSRWNTDYCANCQTHREVKAFVPVHPAEHEALAGASDDVLNDTATYEVEIHTRDGVVTDAEPPAGSGALPVQARVAVPLPTKRRFRLEVR